MYDVVVVGGGAAGIGAARRLARTGLNALLIEAGAELGGRARTIHVDGLALDLGCGWLHSADRNDWTAVAAERGIAVDRRTSAWGRQHHDLGFPVEEQEDARAALNAWITQIADAAPADDNAASALPVDPRWHAYIRAMTGFISGVAPDRVSAADFTAYDQASTGQNWRVKRLWCLGGNQPSSERIVSLCDHTRAARVGSGRRAAGHQHRIHPGASRHRDRIDRRASRRGDPLANGDAILVRRGLCASARS
jgi:hypothetical protein